MTYPARNPGNPDPSDDEVQQRWRELIAGLQDVQESAQGGYTVSSNHTDSADLSANHDAKPNNYNIAEPHGDADAGADVAADSVDSVAKPTPHAGPRDFSLAPEDTSFDPPPAGSILSPNPLLTLGWISLIVGIGLMVASVLLNSPLTWVGRTGFGLALSAAVVLIWQLPKRRNDPYDDGAEV